MAVLVCTDERFADHRPGSGHPERPERLAAVQRGVARAELGTDLVVIVPEPAPPEAVLDVHEAQVVERLLAVDRAGGGALDPDTAMSRASLATARLAAGAGLIAVDHLRAGAGEAAFCVVRPPGHHATPRQSMGFCLLNNVAVTARALTRAGERVAIVDIDAHHGNGTQDIFWADPDVLFVSLHQWPLYPGTGALTDNGSGAGAGTTVNLPLPPGTAGDTYRAAFDRVVTAAVERFAPTWLLVSAGFDAHRADPITELGLSAGDYGDLMGRLAGLVPGGRRIVFLEGGYDLGALEACSFATVRALADAPAVGELGRSGEAVTTGTRGLDVVEAVARLHGLDA